MMTPAAVSLVAHLGASPYAPMVASVVVFVPAHRIEWVSANVRARYRNNGRVEG